MVKFQPTLKVKCCCFVGPIKRLHCPSSYVRYSKLHFSLNPLYRGHLATRERGILSRQIRPHHRPLRSALVCHLMRGHGKPLGWEGKGRTKVEIKSCLIIYMCNVHLEKVCKQNTAKLFILYTELMEHLSSVDRWDRCNLRESERDHLSRSFFVHPLSSHLCSDGQTDGRRGGDSQSNSGGGGGSGSQHRERRRRRKTITLCVP